MKSHFVIACGSSLTCKSGDEDSEMSSPSGIADKHNFNLQSRKQIFGSLKQEYH